MTPSAPAASSPIIGSGRLARRLIAPAPAAPRKVRPWADVAAGVFVVTGARLDLDEDGLRDEKDCDVLWSRGIDIARTEQGVQVCLTTTCSVEGRCKYL